MASVELNGVTLDYHVYSVRAKSLRNMAMNMAVGGRLYRTSGDVAVVRALNNVGFSLKDGDRLAILGSNGSGKSTLLKIIAGIYAPSAGRIATQGEITSMLSYGSGADLEATGLENIRRMGMMTQRSRRIVDAKTEEIVEFSELGHYIRLPMKTYSSGMVARLMFSLATAFDPEILVMDEWLSAGDQSFIYKASHRMLEMVEKAGIVVLATHDWGLANGVCNRILVLEGGAVSFYGSRADWVKTLPGEHAPGGE